MFLEDLHPGCAIAISRLSMDELGVARAMAAGELTSPQKYHNVWLFDIRITGTGHAYRSGIKEHVWRDPELYLNQDFLARCNGLTVVWVHPEKSMLNSKEFSDRVIGSCFLPYIKGEDVWSIAKIYDAEAAADMALQDLSTSPGVVLGGGGDVRTRFEDGSVLLREGKPTLVDHIAIVPAGVWDKGGDPSGIRADSAGDKRMPTIRNDVEKEEKEEERLDEKIKMTLDSMSGAMDSIAKRMDAWEEKDRKRDEDEKERKREDARGKRDAEREEWKKEDAAQCAMDDAEEKAACDAAKADGEDEDMAADKARKDRRAKMDARRKDKEEKDKKDEDEEKRKKEEREDAHRKDSVDIAALVAAELAKRDRSQPDAEAIAAEQERADAVHVSFGTRAPPPMVGETTGDYQIRMARGFQKHSSRWKETNLAVLDAATRGIVVGDIYNDAIVASRSDDHIPPGRLIPFKRTNESGHQITEFRGKDTIFKTFSSPLMAVTQFNTARRA